MPKHEEHEEHENLERWLISYADMLTLMFAFFVMLFAMSQIDLKKLQQFKKGAAGALGSENISPTFNSGGKGAFDAGVAPSMGLRNVTNQTVADIRKLVESGGGKGKGNGNGTVDPKVTPDISHPLGPAGPGKGQQGPGGSGQTGEGSGAGTAGGAGGGSGGGAGAPNTIKQAEAQIEQSLKQFGIDPSQVQVKPDSRGLVVTVVTDKVLFETGQADLAAEGSDILDVLGATLRRVPNQIVVEGHTDSVPVSGGGRYRDNWDLSVARATSVLRHLTEAQSVPIGRMSATGYADTKPIADNGSADGRSRNRRVEIVLLAPTPGGTDTVVGSIDAAGGGSAGGEHATGAESHASGGH